MFTASFPVTPFNLLRGEINRLCEDFVARPQLACAALAKCTESYPALNAGEDEECYFVEAECPGLSVENLELSITGNELNISGTREAEDRKGAVYQRREWGNGKFSRQVSFPVDIDPSKVEAKLKNGVLSIKLPKHEAAQPRKIAVQG